jgi:type II secretory pathway pseudopilin PulG
MSSQKQYGFTVLELIIVIVFLLVVGTVFFVQRRDIEVGQRDTNRKTAINAIYYNLEEVYYGANKAYPESLTADQLKGLDPSLLKDPEDVMIGEENSDYRYEPKDCHNGACKSYELRADLEAEADFVKASRN